MTNRSSKFIVCLVFFTIFIFPNGLVFGSFNAIHNHIFCGMLGGIYLIHKMQSGKLPVNILIIWSLVLGVSIYTKRFGFIDMIALPVFGEFITHKDTIKKYVIKSWLPYICVVFTIGYTFVYRTLGIGGRGEGEIGSGLLISAIGEINLTGLSVFLLAMVIRKKNKLIGYFIMMLGLLTLSRSYILALICAFIFSFEFIKKIVDKIINKINYLNLTVISSVLLFGVSVIFIRLYLSGNIISYNVTAGVSRIFKLNDYSNLFRFLAIFIIVTIVGKHPQTLLLGFSDEEYLRYGKEITSSLGVVFGAGIGTHNLFFSHLKMYGLAVFLEIYLVSKYLKNILNSNNYGIFFGIFLYCIILGNGLSSYWLYLSAIVLILYE